MASKKAAGDLMLKAQFVNGRWHEAHMSLRKQRVLRKECLRQGRYFVGADLSKREWDPRWDITNKAVVMKQPKGHKFERDGTRDEKVKRIEAALKTMDKKVHEMHQKRIAEKPKTFMEKMLIKHNAFDFGKKSKAPKLTEEQQRIQMYQRGGKKR